MAMMKAANPAARAPQTISERPAANEKLSASEDRPGRSVRHSELSANPPEWRSLAPYSAIVLAAMRFELPRGAVARRVSFSSYP